MRGSNRSASPRDTKLRKRVGDAIQTLRHSPMAHRLSRAAPAEVQVAPRCLGLLVQSRCLESPAGDLIVVPGAGAENVALERDAELAIDRAGGNCNVVVPLTF